MIEINANIIKNEYKVGRFRAKFSNHKELKKFIHICERNGLDINFKDVNGNSQRNFTIQEE